VHDARTHAVLQSRGPFRRSVCIALRARTPRYGPRYVSPATPTRRLGLAVLAALLVAVVAGCGSKEETSADPAAVVPARAPVYVEATIPPPGATRDDALAAARKVLGTADPVGRLQELFRGKGGKGNLEPWIGDRVGAFSLVGSTGDGAYVAAVADVDAARDWVSGQGGRTQRYEDVDIRIGAGGTAYALVEDRVVAGTPAAVRATVDAAGGDDLASLSAFKESLDRVEGDDGVGRGYLALRALLEGRTAPSSGGMVGSLATGLVTGSLPTAVGMRFHADGSAVRVDLAGVGGADLGPRQDPAFVAGITGDAWMAMGLGQVGERLKEQLGGSGPILALVGAQSGLDIDKDLLSWMGEGAVFVTGDSPATIGGALVVQSEDRTAMRAAILKLASLITRFATGSSARELHAAGVDAGIAIRAQGVPAPVEIAAAGDRFVVAVGRDALREAISPTSRLGDDPDFRSAAATLGDDLQPTMFIGAREATPLASVLAGRTGASVHEVREALGRFTAAVAADRGERRWRASIGLR
jgi:hypothetical protein